MRQDARAEIDGHVPRVLVIGSELPEALRILDQELATHVVRYVCCCAPTAAQNCQRLVAGPPTPVVVYFGGAGVWDRDRLSRIAAHLIPVFRERKGLLLVAVERGLGCVRTLFRAQGVEHEDVPVGTENVEWWEAVLQAAA